MRKRRLVVLFVLLNLFTLLSNSNAAIFNGHVYEIVPYAEKTWDQATSHMLSFLGSQYYLTTITSQEEQEFIESLLTGTGEYWVGGLQLPTNEPVAGKNWYWVNNEGLFWNNGSVGTYTNWDTLEPNDAYQPGSEQYLAIWGNNAHWNDEGNIGATIAGYIAEAQVPLPSAIILLCSGLIGLIVLRRKYRKG